MEAIPDENTLSYVNTDGTTINFRIGDDVRVAEDGEYVFYRLYDLAGEKPRGRNPAAVQPCPVMFI